MGDTHVHTNISYDAFVLGNRALGLDEAYRFARGQAVDVGDGQRAKLDRPLDFLVIADHSDLFGVMTDLLSENSILAATKTGSAWSKLMRSDPKAGAEKIVGK